MPADVLLVPFPVILPGPTTVTINARISTEGDFGFGISNRSGLDSRLTYQVPAPYERDFCDWQTGVGNYAAATYKWPLPQGYPNTPAMKCVSARFAGFVGAKKPSPYGLTSAGDVLITCDFANLPFDVTGANLASLFGDVNVPWSKLSARSAFEEYATQPDGLLISGTSTTIDRKLVLTLNVVEYAYRRSMVPMDLYPEFVAILEDLNQSLNNDVFMGKERGSLYFAGWDIDDSRDAAGNWVMEFGMTWKWREADWNSEPDDDLFGVFNIIEDSAGNNKYPYKDWTTLINWGQPA